MPPKSKDEEIDPLSAAPNLESEGSQSNEPTKKKRKKVIIACVYCRRSHMICDDKRPCSRCLKRNIGHLCHDEPVSHKQKKKLESKVSAVPTPNTTVIGNESSLLNTPTINNFDMQSVPHHLQDQLSFDTKQQTQQSTLLNSAATTKDTATDNNGSTAQQPAATDTIQTGSNKALYSLDPLFNFNQQPFFFSEHAGSEFSSLNEFLSMLDDPELIGSDQNNNSGNNGLGASSSTLFDHNVNPNNNQNQQLLQQSQTGQNSNPLTASHSLTNLSLTNLSSFTSPSLPSSNVRSNNLNAQLLPHLASQQTSQQPHHLISDSARDKFFLTAADPSTEISPEERLKQVINAKLEAGLLQPYNYAKGYARLQAYMDNYMNQSSKQRILKPLSIFRPAFRAIARTLKDVDLILVEENFERMLLDYDRVFTSMAIPACLWRRTGEIYRGNKEFASLVEVSADDLRDGKLAIYELMSEESAVNFWEKYGAIAFDKGQKAVLTSCNLRTKDGRRRKTCCFSFTIRRDRYNIPSCIVGNFIPINP